MFRCLYRGRYLETGMYMLQYIDLDLAETETTICGKINCVIKSLSRKNILHTKILTWKKVISMTHQGKEKPVKYFAENSK
jgi:hypothetical protein